MKRRPSKYARQRPQVRYFVCPACGATSPATKWKGTTAAGHVKTMYCYRCKNITDHIQQF